MCRCDRSIRVVLSVYPSYLLFIFPNLSEIAIMLYRFCSCCSESMRYHISVCLLNLAEFARLLFCSLLNTC